jgi:hypothetical protein
MAAESLCKIDACYKPRLTRGWCVTHYRRWLRHGDPLFLARTENGEPERYFREVVLAYDGDECLPWPYSKSSNGYGGIGQKTVSRMVCEEINGPPPSPSHEAAHSCGNGHLACVAKRHLSWKTPAENSADRLVHGTDIRGERHKSAKLSAEAVREIRALMGTVSQSEIARRFGVTQANITAIKMGRSWAWLG